MNVLDAFKPYGQVAIVTGASAAHEARELAGP